MQFCTGLGQRDSHAIKLRDGSDNTHPKAGTPYRTICFEDIVAMTQRPPVAAKGAGRWVLASSYAECDARTFAVQAERGSYGMFVVDVDKGNHPFETVRDCSMALLPGQRLLINSTPSAKPEDKRWRIMAPLGMVIPYKAFEAYQLSLFAAFEHNGIKPDWTLSRSAQLIYLGALPQPGAYYEWAEVPGKPYEFTRDSLHWLDQRAAASYRAKQVQAQQEAKQSGPHSVIGWVNRTYLTEDLFENYRYEFDGKEWASPYQQGSGGRHSTMVRPDGSWFSLSDSDRAAGVGKQTDKGVNGDAFDLIKHYAFSGNEDKALEWAKQERRKMEQANPVRQNVEQMVKGMLK